MRLPFAKDVFPYLIPVVIITICLFFVNRAFGVAGLILCAYLLYFFRDPQRTLPEGKGIIVSPADGTIVGIDTVTENDFFTQKVYRISIFLSIFNVHINYAPVGGEIVYTSYQKGKFLPANLDKSSLLNENNTLGILKDKGVRIMVRQIAGIIARRIVCTCAQGDTINQGDKIGMIKFGSRVELYIPASSEIRIKEGDHVKGKISVLGVLK